MELESPHFDAETPTGEGGLPSTLEAAREEKKGALVGIETEGKEVAGGTCPVLRASRLYEIVAHAAIVGTLERN